MYDNMCIATQHFTPKTDWSQITLSPSNIIPFLKNHRFYIVDRASQMVALNQKHSVECKKTCYLVVDILTYIPL